MDTNPFKDELHEGRLRKLNHIIRKTKLLHDHHVLEIGSGWGSFTILVAQTMQNTTIDTIIPSVHSTLGLCSVARSQVEDRIKVHLMDYQNMRGMGKCFRSCSEYQDDRVHWSWVFVEALECGSWTYRKAVLDVCTMRYRSENRKWWDGGGLQAYKTYRSLPSRQLSRPSHIQCVTKLLAYVCKRALTEVLSQRTTSMAVAFGSSL